MKGEPMETCNTIGFLLVLVALTLDLWSFLAKKIYKFLKAFLAKRDDVEKT